MTIETRNLTAGTTLSARYKRQIYTCVVQETEAGSLAFVLTDGRRFTSPSAAASAVMHGISANGWRFWSIGSLTDTTSGAAQPKPGTKVSKLLKRLPNAKNALEDERRWWCSGCMASFTVSGDAVPNACPQGHTETPATSLTPSIRGRKPTARRDAQLTSDVNHRT